MDKKLTLSVNEKVISKAKDYAKLNRTSLSRMVESYLDSITNSKSKDAEITPLVESICGVISLDKDYNLKENYAKYLSEKYK